MKAISIEAKKRDKIGTSSARSSRKEGLVPCVLYGGDENLHFNVDEREFKELIYTPDVHSVKINLGDKKYEAVIREVQFHPVSDRIQHVDFLELIPDREVIMKVPVRLKGDAVGVINGGVLRLKLRSVKVKGLPDALPDNIMIDISDIDIGDSITVGDIAKDRPKLEFMHTEHKIIVRVLSEKRAMMAEVPTAEEMAEAAAEGEEGEVAEGEETVAAEGEEGAEGAAEGGEEGAAEGGDEKEDGKD